MANVKHFEVLPAVGHLKSIKISKDDKLKEPWTIKLGVPLQLKNPNMVTQLHFFKNQSCKFIGRFVDLNSKTISLFNTVFNTVSNNISNNKNSITLYQL